MLDGDIVGCIDAHPLEPMRLLTGVHGRLSTPQQGEWISLKFGGIVRQPGLVCETMYNNKQQPWISTVKCRRIVAWWPWRMPLFHCIGLMAKVSIQEFQANAGEFQHIEINVSS
jgi:hypothetical protein